MTTKNAAKTQAQNTLESEMHRRHMSRAEQWDFLLAAYDAALENDGEVPYGFVGEWRAANAR